LIQQNETFQHELKDLKLKKDELETKMNQIIQNKNDENESQVGIEYIFQLFLSLSLF
jgi:hypothetical protein